MMAGSEWRVPACRRSSAFGLRILLAATLSLLLVLPATDARGNFMTEESSTSSADLIFNLQQQQEQQTSTSSSLQHDDDHTNGVYRRNTAARVLLDSSSSSAAAADEEADVQLTWDEFRQRLLLDYNPSANPDPQVPASP